MYLEDIAAGSRFQSTSRVVTVADIDVFAELSGDHNPIHIDDEAARRTGFTGRVAHGMLAQSISTGLDSEVSRWAGNVYLEGSRRYLGPLYPGDEIHFEVEVTEVRPSRSRPGWGVVKHSIQLLNQHGDVLQAGEDVAMVERRRPAGAEAK
ncbi:MAG: MaoC family dehydratase [Actinobacteria bacterium]|nr:MaoC family dehydratase [Actinomycetota bacterium]